MMMIGVMRGVEGEGGWRDVDWIKEHVNKEYKRMGVKVC